MRRIAGSIFCLLCLLISAGARAQARKITGRVADASGEAIASASVLIKGTPQGTSTDAAGIFSIDVESGQVLIISATGYVEKQLTISATTDLSVIVLARSTKVLDEVVVTALGQTKSKAKIGYSATTFSADAITKNAPVGSLDGLAGKVAGADISNTGGPGSSTKVVLRGYGVISGGDNQPLYVIDGVPLNDARFGSGLDDPSTTPDNANNNVDFGNGMNNVNPNDIESITFLKGTAASSLYGGMAKNGAVMITTKKGRAGKLKVEYTGGINFSRVGKLPDYQDEFGQGWGGQFVLSENGSWGPRLDGKERLWGPIVDNSQLLKPFSFVKNNLRSFYDIGNEITNNLSLSGGNAINRFYFSYGNVFSDGIVPGNADYLERHTFALRTNSTFDRFTINTSFNYVNRKMNAPSTGQPTADGGGVFESVLLVPVDIPIKDFRDYKNQFFNVDNFFSPYGENPYYGLFENGNQQYLDRFFGSLDVNYKISRSFTAEYRLGGDFANSRTKRWYEKNAPSPGSWNDGANPESAKRIADAGSVQVLSDYAGEINMDLMLKFTKKLGHIFDLDALGGANYFQSALRDESAKITDLLIPGFFNLSNTASQAATRDYASLRRREGLYAQATLGFEDQLYLTGNVRNDWSSTLPINNNSIFYPGANVAWIASKTLGLAGNALSLWKMRFAYGRTGSDPDPYQVTTTLVPGSVRLPFGRLLAPFNGVGSYALSNTLANPDLRPIITDEFELGTELGFLGDRLNLDATVYNKRTKGQIFSIPIAPSTGYFSHVENLGTVQNKGIEITLNAKPVETKNFTWVVNYTFSRDWNKVIDLDGSSSKNPELNYAYDVEMRAVVGQSVGSLYAPVPQRSPDGKIVVNDITGLPNVNQTPLDANGMTKGYYGSTLYKYTMGFSNVLTYKNMQLSFSLDFRYGGVMFSETAQLVDFDGNGIATTYNDRKPFVVPNSVNEVVDPVSHVVSYVENKSFVGNNIPPYDGQTDQTYAYYNIGTSPASAYQYLIIDRSFLKLRDINFSYTLPVKWSSKIGAQSASVGIYARNILLWTPQSNVYIDPEASNYGNDLTSTMGEFATVPLSQQYGLIIRAVF